MGALTRDVKFRMLNKFGLQFSLFPQISQDTCKTKMRIIISLLKQINSRTNAEFPANAKKRKIKGIWKFHHHDIMEHTTKQQMKRSTQR